MRTKILIILGAAVVEDAARGHPREARSHASFVCAGNEEQRIDGDGHPPRRR
jgi:hypothetical protein